MRAANSRVQDQRYRPSAIVFQRVYVPGAAAAASQHGTAQPQARAGNRHPVTNLEASQLTPSQPSHLGQALT
jgi:hypothetical protein